MCFEMMPSCFVCAQSCLHALHPPYIHTHRKRRLQTQLKQAEHLLADKEKTADPLQKAPELERQVKAALKRHHAGDNRQG